ncbi:MAG: PD40 domain-containing protein [Tildeniella nuda ZEHNDER 1965/U140]|nr:PD40 domain-containing protein [Tildeniella nuda ZEHNDER 1965/U140]
MRLLKASVRFGLLAVLTIACSQERLPTVSAEFDSRHHDEQPALSGDGHFLAFVSNRNGNRGILLYDLKQRQVVDLPRLNRLDAIAESPSLSYTGRYIVYIASDTVRPEIELYDRVLQQPQILTANYRGWFRNPSISPDGRYVAFETGIRGQWDIEVIDRGPNVESDMSDVRRSQPSASP